MSNIIFFGPPGAGKGTQAKIIAKFLNLPHISTGDVLRSKIKQKDSLGLQVEKIIANGKLVSDDILNAIVSEKLLRTECSNGFILDGYPRSILQSNFLNNFLDTSSLSLDFIFNINIDFEILKMRILKRSEEEKRDDDNISVIEVRYNEYINSTKQVSDKYKTESPDIFFDIEGNDEIDKITIKIKKILKKWLISANICYFFTWLIPYKSCIHPHSFFLDFIMARISGVNIPTNKKVHIALTYIFGIGKKIANDICVDASVDTSKRVSELNDEELNKIRELIDNSYSVEGDLRRKVSLDIKRLNDLGCYRGLRHRKKLPVRGQRTHTNARTRKGKAVAIAGKKKVTKG